MAKEIIILSPVKGKVKELSKVDDPVFAGEMVGKGFAVTPAAKETQVVSPTAKGKIKLAFDGGHAYGIDIKKAEILIHIGVETVGLNGEPFNQKVFSGDKVKAGTVLTEMDLSIIKQKAKSTDTMVLITNDSIGDWKIERIAKTNVEAGEPLFKLVK